MTIFRLLEGYLLEGYPTKIRPLVEGENLRLLRDARVLVVNSCGRDLHAADAGCQQPVSGVSQRDDARI